MKRSQWLVPLVTLTFLLVACEVSLTLARVSTFIFPKPTLIVKALVENWGWIVANLQVTAMEAVVGFALSIVLGITLSTVCLFVPQAENLVVPFAIAIRNVPFVALAPILFMTMGYGPWPKIIIVMIVSFFPIMTNLTAGFASAEVAQKERFFVWRATRWQMFVKLQLPSAIPYFVAGLEIAVSNIIIAAIVGELMGTTKGLGLVIIMAVSQYRFPLLMATVVVTTALSIVTTWLLRQAMRIAFSPWN
ncbi:ABC transporter permease subunit [Candidatus Parcubacteria bacterium]|nr:ABC transporter permease subunit [Patescibacteria group bacterium]MBU4380677.1 ABC transporter permease subunit [Patescibacteria group bacterium]MCG2689594.1 ABC transporter permease subunit [Candidatus Parcubacteria bacterium]